MATTTNETPADALARIQSGFSANDGAVVEAFAAAGIAPDDITPRENVLTFRVWREKGRQVAKGAISLRITVYVPIDDKSGGGSRVRPKTACLFHISQTNDIGAAKGTRPAAWDNVRLIREGTYSSDEPATSDEPADAVVVASGVFI